MVAARGIQGNPVSSGLLRDRFEEMPHAPGPKPGILVLITQPARPTLEDLGHGSSWPQALTLPVSSKATASPRSGVELLRRLSPPIALWAPESRLKAQCPPATVGLSGVRPREANNHLLSPFSAWHHTRTFTGIIL